MLDDGGRDALLKLAVVHGHQDAGDGRVHAALSVAADDELAAGGGHVQGTHAETVQVLVQRC